MLFFLTPTFIVLFVVLVFIVLIFIVLGLILLIARSRAMLVVLFVARQRVQDVDEDQTSVGLRLLDKCLRIAAL